jgi:tryptophan 2,3-dioxygenase
MTKYYSASQILERLQKWQDAKLSIKPTADDVALDKLQRAGISEAEMKAKLDCLTLNGEVATPRVLAGYSDLHALDRLEEANAGIDLSANPKAANVRAVLQAAEIGLLNIHDLNARIVKDIEAGHLGDAEEKYRWVSSFQQTLQSLALLSAKLPVAGTGSQTSLMHSPSAGNVLDSLKSVHRAIASAGLMDNTAISTHDIHEPGRNLSHQAFVDTTYADIWMNSLKEIHIPSVQPNENEIPQAFYRRFVGTDAIGLAVNELDQKGDNFLKQFRAYHQMSEVLVSQANHLIADSIRIVLDPNGNLLQAQDNMRTALDMLEVMNQNVVPILRNLSVNKYQDIRGSLGITSGSHSPNIKHGLFQPLYELFAEAVKLRVMELQPYKDTELNDKMTALAIEPAKNHQTHEQYALLKQAHELHLALRTWRDLHMQFVKTQIGLSPSESTPTASISGSPSAIKAAHGMRHGAHGEKDVIVPVYEAMLGKDFPSVSPFASVFRDSGNSENFVDGMLSATAKVVAQRSAGVQDRVHGH